MNKIYNEKTLSTQKIYDGKIISVRVDTVELPNGNHAKRELVSHPGAVGVLAITSEQKIVFVKQYRKPMDQILLEIPAGKLEQGESPEKSAIRELKEETGYTATNMTLIGSFYTSPGFANEIIHLYLAEGLNVGEATPDEDEFVELLELSIEEVQHLLAKGAINDAKTLVAIYYWQARQLQGNV